MGTERGPSKGPRVVGELRCEWNEVRQRFHIVNVWRVVDSRGAELELIDMCHVSNLEDDEYLERTLTRLVRAMVAEVRSYTEERSAGVQRLPLG